MVLIIAMCVLAIAIASAVYDCKRDAHKRRELHRMWDERDRKLKIGLSAMED